MLLCTVRNCHQVLEPAGRRLICSNGHSFDVARSGYINLLQPQDSRSRQPGDSPAAVAARRRFHESGVTQPLAAAIGDFAGISKGDAVIDAGCGDGYYLGSLAQTIGFAGSGIDISVPAVDAAARKYPRCQWVVANADRFIPWSSESFSLVLSITGRMNSAEFRRVLKENGRLLVAVSSPEDLIELRGTGKDRTGRTIEEFRPQFQLAKQSRVTTNADLDMAAIEDVLLSIYRPMRREPAKPMRLTFSLDLLLFHPAVGP